jgi:hypothetical protein
LGVGILSPGFDPQLAWENGMRNLAKSGDSVHFFTLAERMMPNAYLVRAREFIGALEKYETYG